MKGKSGIFYNMRAKKLISNGGLTTVKSRKTKGSKRVLVNVKHICNTKVILTLYTRKKEIII